MRSRLITVLTVTLLGFAACGGGVSSAAMLDGTLQYTRTGGLAGDIDKLTLKPDGHASVSTRRGKRSFTLSKSERARVKAQVAKADLLHIEVRRGGGGVVSDGFSYTLNYHGHGLSFDQGSIPPVVQKLIDTLDGLVEKHGR
jgi:hypothetical protein